MVWVAGYGRRASGGESRRLLTCERKRANEGRRESGVKNEKNNLKMLIESAQFEIISFNRGFRSLEVNLNKEVFHVSIRNISV